MTQSQVPAAVADYFGPAARTEHPTIGQVYKPGRGWTSYPGTKRVSVSWLRKLRAEGVDFVALDCDGRRADFGINELVTAAARPRRRAESAADLLARDICPRCKYNVNHCKCPED